MSQRDNMLIRAKQAFRQYAADHERKANRFNAERRGCSDEVECRRLEQAEEDSKAKAAVNKALADDIDGVLISMTENVIARTAEFGRIVNPDGFTGTSQQAQMGVHFEEIAEMLVTFKSNDPAIQTLIEAAWVANAALGTALKENSNTPSIVILNRLEFIDAIADQLVTATLSAVQYHMDPVGALVEVNRSNYSKLTDGKMAVDPTTNKWIKGPNYTKANLIRFT